VLLGLGGKCGGLHLRCGGLALGGEYGADGSLGGGVGEKENEEPVGDPVGAAEDYENDGGEKPRHTYNSTTGDYINDESAKGLLKLGKDKAHERR